MPHFWPRMRNDSPFSPSAAQRKVRAAFKASCNCFNLQPWSGGQEPSGEGGYSRTWWYSQAATHSPGLWYYNYFIYRTWLSFFQKTLPNWCVDSILDCELYDGIYKLGYGKDDDQATARQKAWDYFLADEWESVETNQCYNYSYYYHYPYDYYVYRMYAWAAKYKIDLTGYSPQGYLSALLVIIPTKTPLMDEYYCPYNWEKDSKNIVTDITQHLGTIYDPGIHFPMVFDNFWSEIDRDYMGYKAFPKVYLTIRGP
jgi:hypothetical protein